VEAYLGNARRSGMSIQTSNHYVRAIKEFSCPFGKREKPVTTTGNPGRGRGASGVPRGR
jgi:hypothetical protein